MSSRALRTTLIVLGLVGFGLACYLTYVHYSGEKPACTAGETCLKVQTSKYSKLAGVPVALMGLIGYTAILAALFAPENENTRFAAMALIFLGFGFSMYLSYREVFTLKEICEWCASSAVILTIMTPLSIWRYLRGEQPPPARVGGAAAAGPAPEPAARVGSISS